MEKELRSKRITFRLTATEYAQLDKHFKSTLCQNLGDYIRKILLRKPIIVKTRDVSVDRFVEEIIVVKRELNAIGNNLNQAVRKLNAYDNYLDVKNWLILHQPAIRSLFSKIDLIVEKTNQVYQTARHGGHL